MKPLPEDIKLRFFNFLIKKEPISSFEKWVYNSSALEKTLTDLDYLDFLDLDYQDPMAEHEITKLIKRQISQPEFEKWKLLNTLLNVQNRGDNYDSSISEFYDLYCKGYTFLKDLAFCYSLDLLHSYDMQTGIDLTEKEQGKLVNSCYPAIEKDIQKVLNWLNNEQIIVKGLNCEFGNLTFIDNRSSN